ncbi:MAG TPA: oxygenase MpaB family protein [Anaerolineales bacterium]|nr:oxygenase MpaB family protein [Anaerolineales bacterium]
MVPTRWTIPFLNRHRHQTDPAADDVISAVFLEHGVGKLNGILRSLVENDGFIPEHLPSAVHDFLEKTAALPEWADPDLILKGEDFFDRHWPLVITFLFCASLPNAYAAHRGAQVLALTARLETHVERRIFETAQFVLDVMAPGGLSGSGRGIRSAQKVRLMHATIRHLILNEEKWRRHWDMEWGNPINQEDLAGTLMTFSVQILDGFRRFNVPVSTDEQEAYLHVWKVIGHQMGVHPDLLPVDVADGYTLAYAILDHQKGPSEAGSALAAALVHFMRQKMPLRLLRGLPATLIRRCVDPDIADMLEIPPADWTRILVTLGAGTAGMLERLGLRRRRVNLLLDWISTSVIQALIDLDRGGERTPFAIPESLRAPI